MSRELADRWRIVFWIYSYLGKLDDKTAYEIEKNCRYISYQMGKEDPGWSMENHGG